MLNSKFIGVIKSCNAGVRNIKLEDGSKSKQAIYKVKIESSDIDYESMSNWNSAISATLLNIQPMPFKSVDFGDQSTLNLQLDLFSEDNDQDFVVVDDGKVEKGCDASFGKVLITNLTVVVLENIPTYIFTLEIPGDYSGKFLFKSIKSKISFTFLEMDRELFN